MTTQLSTPLAPELVDQLIALARRAGDAILEVYNSDFAVQSKADDSPLTQADLAAHKLLVAGLAQLTPEIPVLSEEAVPPEYGVRKHWQQYWLLDPLDGTKEFVNRNGEFTVNIALVSDGQPMFGVVGVPVTGAVYVGDVAAQAAFCDENDGRRALVGRKVDTAAPLTLVASRSHGSKRLEDFINLVAEQFVGVERTPVGSSLKLCILAEGKADFYPRLGPTSEWDIAAAQAVLCSAGGSVWAVDGNPVAYNKEATFLNPEFFAVADASFDWQQRLPPVPPMVDE